MFKKIRIAFFTVSAIALIAACSGGYSFTGVGGDLGEAKTYSVYMFRNQARLVNPDLSIQFTETLKQEILEQTPLQLVERGGDLEFSGFITDYAVTVQSAQAGETNAQNRLTITLKVNYQNNIDSKNNFEQSFSRFRDYDASFNLNDVEQELVTQINDELAQDIINKALVNW